MEERRQTFWGWVGENPITVVVMLLTLLGGAALLCGYKEGFMSILTGLFGWIKTDDAENKRRLEESRRNADLQFSKAQELAAEIEGQQSIHDQEVADSVESAKAECDEMDIDELIDIGNAMLCDHGVFRGEEA